MSQSESDLGPHPSPTPSASPASVPEARGPLDLDDFVRAFEEAYLERGGVDPAAFVPPPDHPLHAFVVRELVRVDLEFGWERGQPRGLDDYRRAFPALAVDRDGLREVAYEEFRLRLHAGDDPSPEEYRLRYGLDLPERADESRGSVAGAGRDAAGVACVRPRASSASLPEVGDVFQDFHLIGDLGRGAFGRVFLARQGDLSNRTVVLKVTADRHDESQALAQLHHDHIVPIYSQHRQGALRALCMPYLGTVTLRDVLDELRSQGGPPQSGRGLLSSLSKSSERKHVPVRPEDQATATPTPGPRSGRNARRSTVGTDGASAHEWIAGEAGPIARDGDGDGDGLGPEKVPSGRFASRERIRDGHGSTPPSRDEPRLVVADARATIGRLTYVEAVVWMAARLADGLAHAHERGILHRDLKPANVLLTNDGRPMLLDFNLAKDTKRRPDDAPAAPEGIGGTLPYMAPEHLQAFMVGRADVAVDARSDLFAFGVIIYEMLTGRSPYPCREGLRSDSSGVVPAMIADRRRPPPSLRRFNRAVSPAVESIVRRCLDPDPEARYRSARDLAEDLERHLIHHPLRHAAEPSRIERSAKWARRHSWLVRILIAVALATGALGALAAAFLAVQDREARRNEALGTFARFQSAEGDALDLLTIWVEYPDRRAAASERARAVLKPFHVLEDPRWPARPPAASLPPAEQARVRTKVGTLLALMARGELREAKALALRSRSTESQRGLARARWLCDRASAAFGTASEPHALLRMRARIAEGLHGPDEAARLEQLAAATPVSSAIDSVLTGLELSDRGRPEAALPFLDDAVHRDRTSFWVNLSLGLCLVALRRDAEAARVYADCTAIEPGRATGWLLLGGVEQLRGRARQAEECYDRALACGSVDPFVAFSRANTRSALEDHEGALADLAEAERLGFSRDRVHFARARVLEKIGDSHTALLEWHRGLRVPPVDEVSWANRGIAHAELQIYETALKDFEQALRYNPSMLTALQNKAAMLSEHLGRTEDAVRTLDTLLDYSPSQRDARASRGVLLARLGRRDAAHADARAVLSQKPTPMLTYQVAGIFALTSRIEPSDRFEAFRLLGHAFHADPRLTSFTKADPDLDPIRADPVFVQVVESARRVAADLSPSPPPRRTRPGESRTPTGTVGTPASRP